LPRLGLDAGGLELQWGEDGREKTAGTPDVPYLQAKPPSAGPKIPEWWGSLTRDRRGDI